jgi:4-amino-4-deoxy-L-arabinose transferase-like glycosyltransferase
MLVTIGLWLAPMSIKVAVSGYPALEAYRDNILWRQTAERYADPWHHFKPFWFLFAQALLLWLSVTVLLPWLLPAWWRRLCRGDVRYVLLVSWIVLVLLFFSASAAKRGVYILPVAPALALIIAPLLAGLWRKAATQSVALIMALLIAAIFLSVALVGGVLAPGWGDKLLEGYDVEPWWLFAAVGAMGILYAVIFRRRWAFLGLAAYLWSMWLCYGWWAYPLFNPVRSTAPFMAEVDCHIGPSAQLGLVDWKEQFLLCADRPAETFGFSRPRRAQVSDAIAWLQADYNR